MTSPAEELGPSGMIQLANIARRYFVEGHSKVNIAKELQISRFKVARDLERARELGIVKIDIVLPDSVDIELSTKLAAAFGLRSAIVVNAPDLPEETLYSSLGRVAGGVLTETIKPGNVLGVAWGRTLAAMTSSVTSLPPCRVVQMTGALSSASVGSNSIELVRRLTEASQGEAYPIYAPLVLPDKVTAEKLRELPEVSAAGEWYDNIDVAVIPVGSWEPPNSQLIEALDYETRTQLIESGVVADSSTILFSSTGEVLSTHLDDRLIGMSAEKLQHVPEVIAVAGGRDKVNAIAAVLRSGLVTTLVTNSTAARDLVRLKSKP